MAFRPFPKWDSTASSSLRTSGEELRTRVLQGWGREQASGEELHKTAGEVVELARILTKATGSAIAFRRDHGTICEATSGDGAPPVGAAVDSAAGLSRQCLDWGTPVVCEDITKDSRVNPRLAAALSIRAVAIVPVFRNGAVAGILEVFSRTPGAFTLAHVPLLEELARMASVAGESPKTIPLSRATQDRASKHQTGLLPRQEASQNVFFRDTVGLVSLSLREQVPSAPVEKDNWNNVFVNAPLPWKSFVGSIALHIVVLGAAFGLARIWPRDLLIIRNPIRDAKLVYYPPSPAYPARQSSPVRPNRNDSSPPKQLSARKGIPASAQRAGASGRSAPESGALAAPPELAGLPAGSAGRKFGYSSSVLPPVPQVNGGGVRSIDVPESAVVAPPPPLAGTPRLHTMGVASAVVPPSPDIPASMAGSGKLNHVGSVAPGSGIVPPPPAIHRNAALPYGVAGVAGGTGVQIVAPPPSLRGGLRAGRPGVFGIGATNANVVAPAPELDANGTAVRGMRGVGALGSRSQVVPPAPSIGTGGSGLARSNSVGLPGRSNGLSASVVPPAPSITGGAGGQGSGTGLGSRGRGLSTSAAVVPPPPAINGGGNGEGSGAGLGRGRGAGFGGVGVEVGGTAAASSVGSGVGGKGLGGNGTGGSGAPGSGAGGNGVGGTGGSAGAGTGALSASAGPGLGGSGDGASPVIRSAIPGPPAVTGNALHPMLQDLQLRVVGLAMSLPSSSYFSSYEVYIAEKWMGKKRTELIKLVYEFLPYQRRMSEYGFDNSKVYRLRVTRDPKCDESLIHMTWPEGDSQGGQGSAPSSNPADRKDLLPCYRTTADDYRRALSRK